MKTLLYLGATLAIFLLLPGCAEFANRAVEINNDMLAEAVRRGLLTVEQASELQAKFNATIGAGTDYLAEASKSLGLIAGSTIASLTGVRLWRGGIDNRKGTAGVEESI